MVATAAISLANARARDVSGVITCVWLAALGPDCDKEQSRRKSNPTNGDVMRPPVKFATLVSGSWKCCVRALDNAALDSQNRPQE